MLAAPTVCAKHGVVHRIDASAGGAGLNPGVPRHAASKRLSLVKAARGRARLDPWRTVRVGDGPSSFQAGKLAKTVNCIDYRPPSRRRERILRAPGPPRR